MKSLFTFLMFCMSSVLSFAQSVESFYPLEARRNERIQFGLETWGTYFSQSSTVHVTLTSNVDGSVITMSNVYVAGDTYCYGEGKIPATATPGAYAVSVTTSNQGKLTLSDAFTVTNVPPIPELISIVPNMASNGDYVATTIYAQYANFRRVPNLSISLSGYFGYFPADSFVVLSDTTVKSFLISL